MNCLNFYANQLIIIMQTVQKSPFHAKAVNMFTLIRAHTMQIIIGLQNVRNVATRGHLLEKIGAEWVLQTSLTSGRLR